MFNIRLARVTAFHAGRADIICMDGDGMRLVGVPVMTDSASTDTMASDWPEPTQFPAEDSAVTTLDREVVAVVGFMNNVPVIMGFLPPYLSQCFFAEPNRLIHRHASDLYWTVDQYANAELAHPSGIFVRIAQDAVHEDLTGLDVNQRWKISKNITPPAQVTVSHPSGTVVNIDSAGKATLIGANDFDIDVGAVVNVDAPGGVAVTAPVVAASQNITAGTGASGTFTTPTGQIVTVQDGIVTNIF